MSAAGSAPGLPDGKRLIGRPDELVASEPHVQEVGDEKNELDREADQVHPNLAISLNGEAA